MKYIGSRISIVSAVMLVSVLVWLLLPKSISLVAGQGATGRPPASRSKPKPNSGNSKKPPKPQPRSTPSASNANISSGAARNPNAGANNNTARPRETAPAGNVNSGSAHPDPAADRSGSNSNSHTTPSTPGALVAPKKANPTEALDTVPLNVDAWPNVVNRAEPKPTFDRTLLIPFSSQSLEGGSGQVIYTKGEFNGLLGKRKVFVHADRAATADRITARLREYGGLEIVQTAAEAEFALHVNSWSNSGEVFMGISKTFKGGTLIVTIRETNLPVPRIIWRHTEDGEDSAFDKLAKRFIRDLKKLRGEK